MCCARGDASFSYMWWGRMDHEWNVSVPSSQFDDFCRQSAISISFSFLVFLICCLCQASAVFVFASAIDVGTSQLPGGGGGTLPPIT